MKTKLNDTITCAPMHHDKKYRKPLLLEERLSSLATISIEMERFHELRKNKENVYNKEIGIFVQNGKRKDML